MPAEWRDGLGLLVRLASRSLPETSWEPGPGSRPPRHLYRLTPSGREYVAALPAARADQAVPGPQYRWSEA
jgi:PadR family transcriptional regulator, regulatory protein PadR